MSFYGLSFSLDNDFAADYNKIATRTAYGLALAADGFSVSEPEVRTDYIEIKGLDGMLDVSESPQGFPTYKNRTITAKLFREPSPYRPVDAAALMAMASTLQNAWGGRRIRIWTPDDDTHYWSGRAAFGFDADGYITMRAEVYPYRMKNAPSSFSDSTLQTTAKTFTVTNEGRYVIPTITVGQTTVVQMMQGATTIPAAVTLTEGTWSLPQTMLITGSNQFKARTTSGSGGTLSMSWREGKL